MLRGAQGGYTIIELTIVLAVSLVLLVSAMFAVQGANGKTQFAESMRDINSKLISWSSDVTNGFPGAPNSSYSCLVSGGQAQINTGASPTQNPDCIYLGKVIQFTTTQTPGCSGCDTGSLYAYSLFGQRTQGTNGPLTDNLEDAQPVPAIGTGATGTGNADLTEKYSLPNGTTIKSINATLSTGVAAQTRLLGITESFNANASAANGAQNLFLYTNLGSDVPPYNVPGGSTVINCLELQLASCKPPSGQDPPTFNSWVACFASAYDSETATITVTSDNGQSFHTELDFVPCS